jgi:hypothetical protein
MLAKNDEIPCHLAKVPAPKCVGCLFGTMTKLPWRGKESKSSHKVFVATKLGECVSVNYMISTYVGFFAQLKGRLTTKWYRATSIFIDHFSCLGYVHLMQDLLSEETIKAKDEFEQYAAEHGVAIKHYHCDNGCFVDNAFDKHVNKAARDSPFAGSTPISKMGSPNVQFGTSPRVPKSSSCTCTSAGQPQCIPLWPYALRNAALLRNTLPMLEDGSSWLELFSSIRVGAKMAHNHMFPCPVFALQNKLAAGNTIPKWSPRACLGLNLGPSPMHSRNVYLVLNLSTGLVSPQYHCCFDDFFETMKCGGTDVTISSTWQQQAGLNCATKAFSQKQTSTLHDHMQIETPADTSVPLEQLDASTEHQDANWEFHDDITRETIGVTTPHDEPPRNQGTCESEGLCKKIQQTPQPVLVSMEGSAQC